MTSFNKWTPEQEEILLEGIKRDVEMEKIAKKINRSVGAVSIRIKQIALRKLEDGTPLEEVIELTKVSKEDIEKQKTFKKKDKNNDMEFIKKELAEIKRMLQAL